MADYNVRLSRLHHRVWQEELGLSATIDEFGWIQFESDALDSLTIIIARNTQDQRSE